MKKLLALLLVIVLALPVGAVASFAEGEDETFEFVYEFDVNGLNRKLKTNELVIFPNDTDEKIKVNTSEYDFRQVDVMIFNSDGHIVEAGGQLMPNTDGKLGSCQTFINVPPHGFAVAFTAGKNTNKLGSAKSQAMEGAMLYNATMTIDRDIYASFDKENMKLKVWYNRAPKVSDDAKRVLFVGNSSTYFNGSPIKFRALCRAAGIEVKVDYCTFGSAYLSEFADENHERGKAYRNKLKNNKYDYIVFQGAAAEKFETSSPALDVLVPLARENGAVPVLYMRYSYADTFEQMRANGEKHYKNYTELGKRYGCLVSPLAVAYIYAYKDYYPNEINLYAEDLSHHSAEGSYLIACSLMYTIFGVSPVGNTYTAYLDEEDVKRLQECAAKAEETKYTPVTYSDSDVFIDGAEKYPNISEGKKYTAGGDISPRDEWFDDLWYDIDKNGNCLYKFTDGRTANTGDAVECGCYRGTGMSITIDLEEKFAVKAFRCDMFGNSIWQVPLPKDVKVSVSVSNDGENFTPAGDAERTDRNTGDIWETGDFELVLSDEVNARYVRFDFDISDSFLWLSEIKVYGTDALDEPEEPSEEASEETSAEASKEEASDTPEPAIDNESHTGIIIAVVAAVVVIAAIAAVVIVKKKAK